MAKGRYRLAADHYFPGDLYLVAGTVVGDGTPYPVVGVPSFNMTPLDAVAQSEWETAAVGGKPKPEMPAATLNPTGNNPAQGPRAQTGTVSASDGIHGQNGLAGPVTPTQSTMDAAKAIAVQAALIPPEELAKAIEVERARLADIAAEKALAADREAARQKLMVDRAELEARAADTGPDHPGSHAGKAHGRVVAGPTPPAKPVGASW